MPNCIGAERGSAFRKPILATSSESAEASSFESNAIRSRQLTISLKRCRNCSDAPFSTCLGKPMIVFPRRMRSRNEQQREVGAVGE